MPHGLWLLDETGHAAKLAVNRFLGVMSPHTLKLWRWVFLIFQTVVFTTFSLGVTLEFGFDMFEYVRRQSGGRHGLVKQP